MSDGEIRTTDAKTGGQKGSKLARYDLVPWRAVKYVANVFGRGALKYAPYNWKKGYAWGLSFAALQRHLEAFWDGEWLDGCQADCLPDCVRHTNEPHLACAAWHCLVLMIFHEEKVGTDDRPYTQQLTDVSPVSEGPKS